MSLLYAHNTLSHLKMLIESVLHVCSGDTCVAVVLHNGLKVKRPCSSSSKSSPAALNICSSGVPGNILNDT